ncbi:MAG TPA: NAD-dependent epimerase/dehydratase family protein [Streptosporangiaceae bacterium]|nr:NAD-dependent epimerase/dehydratase family protein [Streptosporangiaceae bacterium]
MLVGVTGGTGFVGGHSVAALVRAGHRVRMIVRRKDAVEQVLEPLGVPPRAVDVVTGEMMDESSVRGALRGVDGVLHLASVYSFDPRRHREIRQTNARSTEVVIGEAARLGLNPIVHVSTVGAMFPSRTAPLQENSPVGRPRETYLASKAAAERIARAHQDRGAPVLITYPPALLGPHDPKLGDQTQRMRDLLRGLAPIWPLGGFPLGDVRDTAALHAALFSANHHHSNRYFGPGRYVSTREYVRAVREVTGRALPMLFLPSGAVLPVGALADRLQRRWPWHVPAQYGAVYTVACRTRVSERADTAGLAARPLTETVRDTVSWLCEAGHLTRRQGGAAARRATDAEWRRVMAR